MKRLNHRANEVICALVEQLYLHNQVEELDTVSMYVWGLCYHKADSDEWITVYRQALERACELATGSLAEDLERMRERLGPPRKPESGHRWRARILITEYCAKKTRGRANWCLEEILTDLGRMTGHPLAGEARSVVQYATAEQWRDLVAEVEREQGRTEVRSSLNIHSQIKVDISKQGV